MKRQITLTIIISFFVITGFSHAQSYTMRVNYGAGDIWKNYEYSRWDLKQDIIELESFQHKVDRFIIATERQQVIRARRIKSDIIDLMHKEIRDTRYKIRAAKQELRYEHNSGLRNKRNRGHAYGKRNSGSGIKKRDYIDDRRDLKRLNNRLNRQIEIAFKLENLFLDRSHKYWKQARKHERLMSRFEETLHADIDQSRSELREDRFRN